MAKEEVLSSEGSEKYEIYVESA